MEKKQKVLIVEDEKNIVDILRFNLRKEGYDTLEAFDGVTGLRLALEESPDLILLDLMLPEMNGFDVLTAMNNNRQIEDIPVVMISAENGIEHIERAYDLGVTDYISRPFDCMVVRRRVVNALILAAKQKRLMRLAAEQIY